MAVVSVRAWLMSVDGLTAVNRVRHTGYAAQRSGSPGLVSRVGTVHVVRAGP
jgi:hypothetical protein